MSDEAFEIAYALRKKETIDDKQFVLLRDAIGRGWIPKGSIAKTSYGENGTHNVETVVCPRCRGRGSELSVGISIRGSEPPIPKPCRKCEGHRICYQQTKTWAIPASDLSDPMMIAPRGI